MVGKTFGKYRIVEKIGRGGMGIVYRGVDETLDREVAIKVISPELVDEALVRRFRAEAQTLARVNHPNIAAVYDLFRDDDQLLMVMELVRGQSLEQFLERSGPLTVNRAAALIAQVLDALGHAHAAGIVHRDLKPANLMLTDTGIVKVMDFGIARVSGTERMTSDGLMVGTPAYMAPEQVRGEEVDGRTDLYAAGVVFYRMLTGKLPFKADTAVAMIQSQLSDPPTPARQVRADLPEWLDVVLARVLAKRPSERYQSAEAFRRALDAIAPAPDDITVATPSTPVRASLASPASVATPATPASAATPASGPGTTTVVLNRSHLAMAGGFGLLLLAAIGVLAWLAIRRPVPPAQIVTAPVAVPTAVPAISTPAPSPSAPPGEAKAVMAPPPVVAKGVAAPTSAALPAGATPSPIRRGLGGPTPPRPPEAGFQPTVIRDARALLVLDGRDTQMVGAILAFSERSITATDVRNGVTVKSFPYDAVKHVSFSRGRLPRGTGGADVRVRGGIPEGNVLTRGPRLWLTIETADDRLVLRLDPPALRPALDLVQQRMKVRLERFEDPNR